jgi:Mrp family chromosome partitioning ATPase
LSEAILKPEWCPVSFVVRGRSGHSPAELLHSARLPAIVKELTRRFDLVLLDSAPVNPVSDTHLLASSCDGVLLVARAFFTSATELAQASKALSPNRILGTIMNGSSRHGSYYWHHAHH